MTKKELKIGEKIAFQEEGVTNFYLLANTLLVVLFLMKLVKKHIFLLYLEHLNPINLIPLISLI